MMISYYRRKIQENTTNTKKLWKVINNIIGKYKHSGSIISYITIDGVRKYDPDTIANEFGHFYSHLGPNLANKINKSEKSIEEYMSKIPNSLHSLVLHSTSALEIEKIALALPNKTSCGHDKISNQMLKSIIPAILTPLSIVFNQSIVTGKFPQKMKQAEVVPLHKGKDMDLVINYRPISLLITISKLLEKVIYKRVYSFLEKENILFQSQYGFRSNHNCEHAILELTGNILQAHEKREHPVCIYLDLSKAFDTLNHQVLLCKLEKMGIRGITNSWFESYLSGRSLVTKVTTSENNTTYSDAFDISFGTAQGSCLGPLFFLLFCNDIHLLPLYSQLILFTYDTTLFNSHKSEKFLEYMLNCDLEILLDWFNANQLSINLEKTVMMQFWPKNAKIKIKARNNVIPIVRNTKFLGVFMDDTLSWKTHVEYLHNKLSMNQHMLQTSKNKLDKNSLRNVYFSHIHSHLVYGIKVLGPSLNAGSLDILCKQQNKCVRQIERGKNLSKIYKNLNILKLTDMIKLEQCKLCYQLGNNLLPKPIQQLFQVRGGRKQHRYPTRNKALPNVQSHSGNIFHTSFMCKSLSAYSSLPLHLQRVQKMGSFVNKTKQLFLSNY